MMMCMAKLPDDYRDVVQRVYLDEQPIAEVARELGRTEDAVRRLAGRAVERLAASMGEASRYLSQAS
jgi:DNA-directed RNA polymerase specialized sigma24 family protein